MVSDVEYVAMSKKVVEAHRVMSLIIKGWLIRGIFDRDTLNHSPHHHLSTTRYL
jgi:hypothetical protein